MNNRPRIVLAILTGMLAFIVFAVVYFVSYIIIGGLILILLKLPLIGKLIDFLFYFRGDSPTIALSIICPGIAYSVVMAIQSALNKTVATKGLSCIFLGVGILLLQVISLILNIIYKENVWTNIVLIVTGLIFLFNGIGYITNTENN